MWFFFALLSAIFAALTSILAKIGIEGVPSNLATAIRTVVVILMAWAMVFLTNSQTEIVNISKKVGSFSSYLAWPLAPPGSATKRPCRWAMRLRYLLSINSVSSLPSF